MEVISLFAGCGGLDLGFRRAGFNVKWANENDLSIHKTYLYNHPQTVLNTSDIRILKESEIPDCDGIIGGPPCQAWSLGGMSLGLNDERGRLIYDYIRIVKWKRPKFFIMENVPGMVCSKHIETFLGFLRMFSKIGYKVKYKLINAADFKIPQNRLRIFVVGIRDDINVEYFFPVSINQKHITLAQAIGDLKYYQPRPYYVENVIQKDEQIPNHDYYTGSFTQKFMARNRVRSWNEQSFTIQAQAGNVPLHPQAPKMLYVSANERKFAIGYESEYRHLSVRECARIQSFPDDFYFIYDNIKDAYKMVGNAVPPRLSYLMAVSIKKCLDNTFCNVLVGYVKSERDLDLIVRHKIYYVRRGSRVGAMQRSQIENNIKILYLHRGDKRYAFELADEKVISCNNDYLKKLGFTPSGNEYWIFNISKEINDIENLAQIIENKCKLIKKPIIIKISSNVIS